MSDKGIKLSPKYGLNPCIAQCFFCGEEKGISLLGRIYKIKDNGKPDYRTDVEAPKKAVLDYEPCPKCLEKMQKGLTLIEISYTPVKDDVPHIGFDQNETPVYPTGRWLVLVNKEHPLVQNNIGKRMLCLDTDYQGVLDKINNSKN